MASKLSFLFLSFGSGFSRVKLIVTSVWIPNTHLSAVLDIISVRMPVYWSVLTEIMSERWPCSLIFAGRCSGLVHCAPHKAHGCHQLPALWWTVSSTASCDQSCWLSKRWREGLWVEDIYIFNRGMEGGRKWNMFMWNTNTRQTPNTELFLGQL